MTLHQAWILRSYKTWVSLYQHSLHYIVWYNQQQYTKMVMKTYKNYPLNSLYIFHKHFSTQYINNPFNLGYTGLYILAMVKALRKDYSQYNVYQDYFNYQLYSTLHLISIFIRYFSSEKDYTHLEVHCTIHISF